MRRERWRTHAVRAVAQRTRSAWLSGSRLAPEQLPALATLSSHCLFFLCATKWGSGRKEGRLPAARQEKLVCITAGTEGQRSRVTDTKRQPCQQWWHTRVIPVIREDKTGTSQVWGVPVWLRPWLKIDKFLKNEQTGYSSVVKNLSSMTFSAMPRTNTPPPQK